MFLHRRAIYNMIYLPDAPEVKNFKGWQKENYRCLKDTELLKRLGINGLSIPNLDTFQQVATDYASPDEMADELAPEEDQIYLLLFELWRRHLPEQRCPSVFCDELDFQIAHFERGDLSLQEELKEIVDYLLQIFDDHVDEGADPHAVYRAFQEYCAHNLDQFLYNYVATQIDSGNIEYAYDLIDGFYRYVSEPLFFEFQLARVAILQDPESGTLFLEKLIRKVKRLDLAEEILLYLAQERNHPLFCQLVLKTLPLLEDEGNFCELLDLCIVHFDRIQIDSSDFKKLFDKHAKKNPDSELDPKDADVKEVKKLIKKKLEIET